MGSLLCKITRKLWFVSVQFFSKTSSERVGQWLTVIWWFTPGTSSVTFWEQNASRVPIPCVDVEQIPAHEGVQPPGRACPGHCRRAGYVFRKKFWKQHWFYSLHRQTKWAQVYWRPQKSLSTVFWGWVDLYRFLEGLGVDLHQLEVFASIFLWLF